MRTLSQILVDANAFLDLDAAVPTSSELTSRVNYANQAVWDAAGVGQLKEFHTIYEVNPGSSSRVSLPANFRELMAFPKQPVSDGAWDEFEEIDPLDRFSKASTDKYCYVIGNPMAGYTAVFNGLSANVTISLDYQRYPSGMATLSDICELPDPTFVTSKTESYVLKSRSDDRYPVIENEANLKLQNMFGRNMKTNGRVNTTRRSGAAAYAIGG